MRHVVVGVEDLPRSRAALEWAARAADQRNAVLRMVHATGLPVAAVDLLGDLLRDEAHELLDRATAVVHEVAPTVEVDLVVEPRRPLHALVEAAEDADLLVVGGRHDGVGDRLRAGSLPYQASAAAGCHVVVVPGPVRHDASGVVVGVDGSMDCVAAVAAAAAEADATRQPLQVLHAWQEPTLYASIDVYPEGLTDQVREEARVALGESVAGLAGRYPDLVVHERSNSLLTGAKEL
ncbi:MAG TPA: universal stress protein, partial [Actinotalea sp.]|nr:universal stress protein [Actinotalea sp.]